VFVPFRIRVPAPALVRPQALPEIAPFSASVPALTVMVGLLVIAIAGS
jgi:hypothetical protein